MNKCTFSTSIVVSVSLVRVLVLDLVIIVVFVEIVVVILELMVVFELAGESCSIAYFLTPLNVSH